MIEEEESVVLLDKKGYVRKTFNFAGERVSIRNLLVMRGVLLDKGTDVTGHKVWPASMVLGLFLIKNREKFADKTILEVGAGTGLCGILASKVSKKTVVTDGDQSVLDLISENVTLNQLANPPDVLALEWGTDASALVQTYGKFNYITGSDIIYPSTRDLEIPLLLLNTVDQLLKPHGKFYLGYKARDLKTIDIFMEAAKTSKFNVREVDVKALFSPEEPPEETFLYIVEREGEVGDD